MSYVDCNIKSGDIIRWEGTGVNSKDMRVVEVWNQGEPFQYLVTPLDDYSSTPKCYVVLAVDCVLVRKGEPPKRIKSRAGNGAGDIWKVPDGCVVAEDR